MPSEHPIIAIIGGTGKEGTGLALRWATAGYKILIGSRSQDKARMAAERINQQVGKTSVTGLTNHEAAKAADICILTVVHSAHQEALENIRDVMGGKILVDATSRVNFQDPKPPAIPSAAEQAVAILGQGVRVVAAFQNVPARTLGKNITQRLDADVLVCSDDLQAAEQVIQLAESAGMHGYYVGLLVNANVVEGLTSLLISLNKYYGVKDASIMVTGIPSVR